MSDFVNNGAPSTVAASAGMLVLGIATMLWFFEPVELDALLPLLCCSAMSLVLFGAWRHHLASTSRLRQLEGTSHRLACSHRQLQRQLSQQSDELMTSCRNYQQLVENSNSIILRWNVQGTIRYANTYALNFFGYSEAEFVGKDLLDTIVPSMESTGRDLSLMIEDISRYPERYVLNENENICKDRRRVWIAWTNKVVCDSSGNTIEVLSVGNDVTDKKQYERQIYQMAHYDPLTQLPNRNHLKQCLTEAIDAANQTCRQFSLLYIGLDRFKPINDSLGHDQGDLLLQQLSERMQFSLHRADTIARMGGDEFCVVLSSQTNQQQALLSAQEVASELLALMGQAFTLDRGTAHITGSIGITTYPDHGVDASQLINHAETAMYRAKARSGNGIQLFEPSMSTRALQRLKLENALRTALENDSLDLYYQPALNLATGKVDYMEALLRWNHPELGAISPSQFIDVAEETGLMPSLGQWVLKTATRQAALWRKQGYGPMLMAVNLSARQFECDSLLNNIRAALSESGLPAHCLALEITESTIMHDVDYGQQLLRQISELGITLLIDDFGTGHSSLSRLRNLPIHTVKIDQSFIRDISPSADRKRGKMVDAIISMAHGLHMQVIAEGVETEQQKHYLAQRGCDRVQGYLVSRAQSARALETGPFLDAQRATQLTLAPALPSANPH
jgi:diguanylate cyclase (GGDEF)-like protein/PAS domain S-box-containing protein